MSAEFQSSPESSAAIFAKMSTEGLLIAAADMYQLTGLLIILAIAKDRVQQNAADTLAAELLTFVENRIIEAEQSIADLDSIEANWQSEEERLKRAEMALESTFFDGAHPRREKRQQNITDLFADSDE